LNLRSKKKSLLFIMLVSKRADANRSRLRRRATEVSELNTKIGMSGTLVMLMAIVFMTFAVTGAALPTLPLHLQNGLGQSTFMVGLIAGTQFFAALVSRVWAGSFVDRRGPKQAMVIGLCMAVTAGALYLYSLAVLEARVASVIILALGRVFMGGAECFVIVGSVTWALRLLGAARAGKAIAQMGTVLYIGSVLFDNFGFQSLGLTTFVLPIFALLAILPLPSLSPEAEKSGGFWVVMRSVWLPGLGLSFASLGYGAMMSFSVLFFVERHWQPAWLAFTTFAIAFIAVRVALGNLADRLGGARIAQIFAVIQVAGLALMAVSPWITLSLVGSALTGIGYSLVYPGLGLEAVNRAPVASKGLAIGTFTAFLELTLALTSPLLGLLASWTSLGSVFMVSAVSTAGAVCIAGRLRKIPLLLESAK
jgi:MFS family permease